MKIKKDLSLGGYERPKLVVPNKESKLLLHSCCAPCAGEIMEAIASSEIETTVFFYNPNIHPKEEYEIRKDENKRFCDQLGFEFIDADESGEIDAGELADALRAMGQNPSVKEVESLMRSAGNGGDNTITFTEFSKMMKKIMSSSKTVSHLLSILLSFLLEMKY